MGISDDPDYCHGAGGVVRALADYGTLGATRNQAGATSGFHAVQSYRCTVHAVGTTAFCYGEYALHNGQLTM